ncbi:glycosyltransferase family 4 protein [Microbacterium oryzae]|uniref:glycosyltransferase family 4 protein n=1 Tax=Microbacterium oryzae TaxID=743009 RepID=UPI00339DA079
MNFNARVAILSPWGASGGYSGPLTFLNRLWGSVKTDCPAVNITLLYRDRGEEARPAWADRVVAGVRSARFGRLEQARWVVKVSTWLLCHRFNLDVVHLHGSYTTNLVPALFARRGQVVIVPVLESGDLGGLKHAPVKRWVARRVVSRARAGLALSEGIVEELKDLGLPQSRITRLANPADPRMLDVPVRKRGSADPIRLGFVGKLGPLKNPHLLMEAASLIRERGREVEVHYYGPFASHAVAASLKSLAAAHSSQLAVYFHGFTRDVTRAFSTFDVLVLPSAREGLPGALTEALATGTPAVVSAAGGMGELVRASRAGRVVAPEAADIASAVLSLVEPGEYERATRSAREFASSQLSPEAVAREYTRKVGIARD